MTQTESLERQDSAGAVLKKTQSEMVLEQINNQVKEALASNSLEKIWDVKNYIKQRMEFDESLDVDLTLLFSMNEKIVELNQIKKVERRKREKDIQADLKRIEDLSSSALILSADDLSEKIWESYVKIRFTDLIQTDLKDPQKKSDPKSDKSSSQGSKQALDVASGTFQQTKSLFPYYNETLNSLNDAIYTAENIKSELAMLLLKYKESKKSLFFLHKKKVEDFCFLIQVARVRAREVLHQKKFVHEVHNIFRDTLFCPKHLMNVQEMSDRKKGEDNDVTELREIMTHEDAWRQRELNLPTVGETILACADKVTAKINEHLLGIFAEEEGTDSGNVKSFNDENNASTGLESITESSVYDSSTQALDTSSSKAVGGHSKDRKFFKTLFSPQTQQKTLLAKVEEQPNDSHTESDDGSDRGKMSQEVSLQSKIDSLKSNDGFKDLSITENGTFMSERELYEQQNLHLKTDFSDEVNGHVYAHAVKELLGTFPDQKLLRKNTSLNSKASVINSALTNNGSVADGADVRNSGTGTNDLRPALSVDPVSGSQVFMPPPRSPPQNTVAFPDNEASFEPTTTEMSFYIADTASTSNQLNSASTGTRLGVLGTNLLSTSNSHHSSMTSAISKTLTSETVLENAPQRNLSRKMLLSSASFLQNAQKAVRWELLELKATFEQLKGVCDELNDKFHPQDTYDFKERGGNAGEDRTVDENKALEIETVEKNILQSTTTEELRNMKQQISDSMLAAAGVMIRNKKNGRSGKLLNPVPEVDSSVALKTEHSTGPPTSANNVMVKTQKNSGQISGKGKNTIDELAVDAFWNAQVRDYHSQLKSYLMWGENHQKDADHFFVDGEAGPINSMSMARASMRLPRDFVESEGNLNPLQKTKTLAIRPRNNTALQDSSSSKELEDPSEDRTPETVASSVEKFKEGADAKSTRINNAERQEKAYAVRSEISKSIELSSSSTPNSKEKSASTNNEKNNEETSQLLKAESVLGPNGDAKNELAHEIMKRSPMIKTKSRETEESGGSQLSSQIARTESSPQEATDTIEDCVVLQWVMPFVVILRKELQDLKGELKRREEDAEEAST